MEELAEELRGIYSGPTILMALSCHIIRIPDISYSVAGHVDAPNVSILAYCKYYAEYVAEELAPSYIHRHSDITSTGPSHVMAI